MVKKIGLGAVLLAIGVAIAMWVRGGLSSSDPPAEFQPQSGASAEVRIGDLEKALTAQIDRVRTLEGRVAELESRLAAAGPGQGPNWRDINGEGGPRAERLAELRELMGEDGRPDPAALRQRLRERQLEQLVEAGFTRERAEWIERRTEELEVQAMQAQYDAQRSGRPGQGQFDTDRALRSELGDAEYERYLSATGRPTDVRVMDVLASSAAEKSGLKAGDQILSYGGTRVFDMRELNALTREGSSGESVTVEVKRDGQTVQLQVPRGPLGVSGGGGFRGGPPGGPGAFRGGR